MKDFDTDEMIGQFDKWMEIEEKNSDMTNTIKANKKDISNRIKEFAETIETTAKNVSDGYKHYKDVIKKGSEAIDNEDVYTILGRIDTAMKQEDGQDGAQDSNR